MCTVTEHSSQVKYWRKKSVSLSGRDWQSSWDETESPFASVACLICKLMTPQLTRGIFLVICFPLKSLVIAYRLAAASLPHVGETPVRGLPHPAKEETFFLRKKYSLKPAGKKKNFQFSAKTFDDFLISLTIFFFFWQHFAPHRARNSWKSVHPLPRSAKLWPENLSPVRQFRSSDCRKKRSQMTFGAI